MTTADKINLIIAIATAASTIASLAVVFLTLRVLQANRAAVGVMKAQLDATTRPYILIVPVARPMTTLLELRIVNTGSSAAESMRLSLDKDYYFNAEDTESSNLRRYEAFVHPIESFPPRAELKFALGIGHRILTSDRCPLRFTVTAEYSWSGQHCVERTRIDLQPYAQSGQPIDAVAERLDKIARILEKGSKRPEGAV